jgi:hypothetical protein
MGRPLSKKFFGNPALSGNQIALNSAWVPGESAAASGFYIVRQVGTGRYQVTNGSVTGVVRLVAAGTLTSGQAHLKATPFGGSPEYIRILHGRTIKTWEGNTFSWSGDDANATGEATMRFAFAGAVAATISISDPQVGVAATISVSGATNGGTVTARQWTIDGVNVSGATAATYTPIADDATKALAVKLTFTNSDGVTNLLTTASKVVAAA